MNVNRKINLFPRLDHSIGGFFACSFFLFKVFFLSIICLCISNIEWPRFVDCGILQTECRVIIAPIIMQPLSMRGRDTGIRGVYIPEVQNHIVLLHFFNIFTLKKLYNTGSPCNSRFWISRICNSRFFTDLKMPAFWNKFSFFRVENANE